MIPFLGTIISGVTTYFTNRQEMSKEKQKSKLELLKAETNAKIKRLETQKEQDYSLDKIAMQDMKNSYLDEVLLIAFLYPVFQSYSNSGFSGLDNVPVWYLSLVVGMVVVKYGMRGMLRDYMGGKYKKVFKG